MNATQNISQNAVLVHLRVSRWYGNQKDEGSQREIAERHNAENDAVAVTIKLMPRALMLDVLRAEQLLKQAYKALSLPWMSGGVRILPSGFLDKYNEAVRECTERFNIAVDNFCAFYDSYRQSPSAKNRLGTLAATLPTTDEVRSKFNIENNILPLPNVQDFRFSLGGDSAALKAKMEASMKALTAGAMKDIWTRFNEIISRIYKQTSKEKGKIYDNLLGNLKDFCDDLKVLNITNDPDIEAMRQTCIEQLGQFKAEDIRSEQDTRKSVATNAKEILESIRKIDLDIE